MKDNDKHDIRRKIEETRTIVRERRKVRERLSRECAGNLARIASIKSNIKRMMAEHETALAAEKEEFMFATAADRREIQQCEDKRAELDRELASSDIVEREQAVASKRLACLRVADKKEETANAREMESLKKTLFNAETELENAFRTTLHNLNVSYQEQAFDAMVEEATKAEEELPSLRQALRTKTRDAMGLMAKHCTRANGAMHAKAERDVVEELVKLQAQRKERLKRKLSAQRELVEREHSAIMKRGEQLEAFQVGAGKLRAAAAELRRLQVESSRKRRECRNVCMLAYKLVDKGPKAVKAERKRKRLAQLSAAVSSIAGSSKACPKDDAATSTASYSAADLNSLAINRDNNSISVDEIKTEDGGGVQEEEKQAYDVHDKGITEEADERIWRASLSAADNLHIFHRRQKNHYNSNNTTSSMESCGHIISTATTSRSSSSQQNGDELAVVITCSSSSSSSSSRTIVY